MKVILRISLLLVILLYGLLELFPAFFLEQQKVFGGMFIGVSVLSGFVFLISLFIFWVKAKFINTFVKIIWLLVYFFMYGLIGPIVFYLIVFEFKKTLKS